MSLRLLSLSSVAVTLSSMTLLAVEQRMTAPVRLAPYVFYQEVEALDYDFATNYLAWAWEPSGMCSGVVSPDHRYHGRNLDWYYNADASVVCRTSTNAAAHASVGICITTVSDADMQNGYDPSEDRFKIVPFRIDDGINDAGLTIQVNVTHYAKDPNYHIEEWKSPTDRRIPGYMVVRWVLDNFTNAYEAASNVCAHAYPASTTGFSHHWLISDAVSTWLVEDGAAIDISDRPYMTNFRVAVDPRKEGSLDFAGIQERDRYAIGLERYLQIMQAHSGLNVLNKMKALMRGFLNYSRAYDDYADPRWWSECCGFYDKNVYDLTGDIELTVLDVATNNAELCELAYQATKQTHYKRERSPDNQSWQTTWSAIYDRAERKLMAVFQEGCPGNEQELVFSLEHGREKGMTLIFR